MATEASSNTYRDFPPFKYLHRLHSVFRPTDNMATEVCYNADGGPQNCFTMQGPTTHNWYQDPALYEFLSTRAFWALGIFIATNCYWVDQQTQRFNEVREAETNASEATGQVASTTASPNRYSLFWLQPHITSRPRQILAIILSSLVIPLQLLEGYWILKTAWRVTAAMFEASSSISVWLLRYLAYLPLTAVIIIGWLLVVVGGIFVVNAQLLYVLQLRELQPDAPPRSTVHARQPDSKEKRDQDRNSAGEGRRNEAEGGGKE